MGRFSFGRHELVCATTHLDFDEAVQVASAEIILDRSQRLAADRPVILGGDFNCAPTTACHAVFTCPKDVPGQGSTAFRNVLYPPFPGTFHGFQGGQSSTCIDWILYRGVITVEQARVIQFQHGTCYPSDHYPVAADFVWKDPSRV
jgi:endonuclease/exonuclease/phosphatase family metal-dependent hydrolase